MTLQQTIQVGKESRRFCSITGICLARESCYEDNRLVEIDGRNNESQSRFIIKTLLELTIKPYDFYSLSTLLR